MPTNDAHAYIPPDISITTTLSPSNINTNYSLLHKCDGQFEFAKLDAPILAACAIAFTIGLVYSFLGAFSIVDYLFKNCIVGYRFFKIILFMTGLAFGTIIIYVISDKERLLNNK